MERRPRRPGGACPEASTDGNTETTVTLGTLCKYAAAMAVKLDRVGNWTDFVLGERGRPDIAISAETLPHKAARLMKHMRRRGAAVPMRTAPWDNDRLRRAAQRGSHKSAEDEIDFVCQELLEFCDQGFWTVLPLSLALQLSPLGVVPQCNRRPRLIVNYTFSSVNEDTVRVAPLDAMQFGKTLQRLLSRIAHANPTYGPVWLGKIDIADGLYRISLQPRDIPRLGVILPSTTDDPLVALPFALPMGWVESPPYFTTATETASDLLNDILHTQTPLPPHPLKSLAATPPTEPVNSSPGLASKGVPVEGSTRRPPLVYGNVYVDDFILAAQTQRIHRRVLRAALHSIKPFALSPRTIDQVAKNQCRSKSCAKGTHAGRGRKVYSAGDLTRAPKL